jgi:hypothetical protein
MRHFRCRMGVATNSIMAVPASIRGACRREPRDIYDPYRHIDQIKVTTRDFR